MSPAAGAPRTAVVTGASRGIGLAVARRLVAAGTRVAMIARGAEALRARAKDLGGPTHAVPIPCDLADADAIAAAAGQLLQDLDGGPELLVNNAGIFALASIDMTPVASFRKTLDVNLVAPFALLHALLPRMRERGVGQIVTIGSVSDRHAFPDNGAYTASKFGLRALHQVLRAELRGSGIRASLVSPGPVDTEIWDPIDPDARPGFTPRRAMLQADDIAAAVWYVVSQPSTVDVSELRLSHV